MDQYCPKGSRPVHITVAKANTPNSTMKDFQVEEPKTQDPESLVIQCSNNNESFEKVQRIKKKKQYQKNQEHWKASSRPPESMQLRPKRLIKRRKTEIV